ncbi:MAG: hypothetical protein ACXQT4_07030 [Methanotrichaceae archaeon]
MTKLAAVVGVFIMVLGAALAQPGMIHIGSKTDPEASLFTYDHKFGETTCLKNYDVGMFASKEFSECTHLTSNTYLKSNPHWVDLAIGINFTGVGRMGYVVLDPDTMDRKDEMARVSHDFVGTFSIDEKVLVIKDHMNETGYFGPGQCV